MADDDVVVVIEDLPLRPTVVSRFQVSPAELGARLAQVLPKIFAHVSASGRGPGHPFTRYHAMRPDRLDVEAGLMVDAALEGLGAELQPSELPKCKAAATWHVGPYDRLAKTHDRLQAWAKKSGKAPAGPLWEVYVTDPADEPDPQKWRTRVYLPVSDR